MLNQEEIGRAATELMKTYVDDFEECFPMEMIQFCEFYKTIRDQEQRTTQNLSTEMEMLLLLNENMCSQSFPNVHIALRIYLAMATSNCSGERSFSKMKRIKNELRGCMRQQRLTFLSLMSIENDIVESLSFNDIISDFAQIKSRKKSMWFGRRWSIFASTIINIC